MTDNFENKAILDVHASRWIASWLKVGGRIDSEFNNWLRSICWCGKSLTEDEVRYIWHLATNGKMELQDHARSFHRELPERKEPEEARCNYGEVIAKLMERGATKHESELVARICKRYGVRLYM